MAVEFPTVEDRNVATPSRVKLVKAVGIEEEDVYDVVPEPGTVYAEGTPLNKAFFDQLKRYIDASSGAGEILGIQYGGTGADNEADARTNLDVYSKGEVDEAIDRTKSLIEPHITRRVTDTTDGVHGFYIDEDYTMWIDPDGDGVYEAMPTPPITGWPADESSTYTAVATNAGSGWNTQTYPVSTLSSGSQHVTAWVNDPNYDVQTLDISDGSFLYKVVDVNTGEATADPVQIEYTVSTDGGIQ